MCGWGIFVDRELKLMVYFVKIVQFFMNYAIFHELCDQMQSEVDCAKLHKIESQKEISDRRMEVLSTKTKTRIGFWNMSKMYETRNLAQVTAEMRRYNLHILGIRESRWTGSGRYRTNTGETVLYSGRDEDQHHEGVTIILRKGME